MPLFFPRPVNLAGLFHASYFPTMSVFIRCRGLSLSIVASVVILPEEVYVIACALSYMGACLGLLQDESGAPDI